MKPIKRKHEDSSTSIQVEDSSPSNQLGDIAPSTPIQSPRMPRECAPVEIEYNLAKRKRARENPAILAGHIPSLASLLYQCGMVASATPVRAPVRGEQAPAAPTRNKSSRSYNRGLIGASSGDGFDANLTPLFLCMTHESYSLISSPLGPKNSNEFLSPATLKELRDLFDSESEEDVYSINSSLNTDNFVPGEQFTSDSSDSSDSLDSLDSLDNEDEYPCNFDFFCLGSEDGNGSDYTPNK